MVNINLITKAVTLADKILSMNGIYEDPEKIIREAYSWYSNTDITDAELLAAAIIAYGYYKFVPYDEIEDARNFYFAPLPDYFDETPIWEIEQAQRDSIYF